MASGSSSSPASRFASPPKKQCIDKAEACYLYYIQATYDDRRTFSGELMIGLSFKRKVSQKYPTGKDLPFPDDQKLMQIEKEVIQKGRADGRLESVKTDSEKKVITFSVYSPDDEERVLSIINKHFKNFKDGHWMEDYQEYVSKYYGITHTKNTVGDVIVYAIEPLRDYLLDASYEFKATETDTFPLVMMKVAKNDGKLQALKELGSHYDILIKEVDTMPSIHIKKPKPANGNWCAKTGPAPPCMHAYQTIHHTIWHPMSTDHLEEERNINSNTSTASNQHPYLETPETKHTTPTGPSRGRAPCTARQKNFFENTFLIISFSCNGIYVLRVWGAVRDRLVTQTPVRKLGARRRGTAAGRLRSTGRGRRTRRRTTIRTRRSTLLAATSTSEWSGGLRCGGRARG